MQSGGSHEHMPADPNVHDVAGVAIATDPLSLVGIDARIYLLCRHL